MDTILITGINGFLGSYLARNLTKKFTVIGIENNVINLQRIEDLQLKVYDSEKNLNEIFTKHDINYIIHAATVYKRNSDIPNQSIIETNILLPIKLLELAKDYQCFRLFINIDSFFAKSGFRQSYLQEYTMSKRQVLTWLKLMSVDTYVINMQLEHIYGEGDSKSKFIPSIILKLFNSDKILLTKGDQRRDFVYIEDVYRAFLTIIQDTKERRAGFENIEVGMGHSISIKDVVLMLKSLTGSNSELIFGALEDDPNKIEDSFANTKILSDLGWYPLFSRIEGFTAVIESLKKGI